MGVKAVIEDRPGTDSVTVTYECPITPRENHLQIPVRAGERLKKGEAKG